VPVGNSKTMKPVRTKAINDIRFLTPPNANFDARRPVYREDEQYAADTSESLRFTDTEKARLKNAAKLALEIVEKGYQAMHNYLRFRSSPGFIVFEFPKVSNLIFWCGSVFSKKRVGMW
jgi:hypothetical protein